MDEQNPKPVYGYNGRLVGTLGKVYDFSGKTLINRGFTLPLRQAREKPKRGRKEKLYFFRFPFGTLTINGVEYQGRDLEIVFPILRRCKSRECRRSWKAYKHKQWRKAKQ